MKNKFLLAVLVAVGSVALGEINLKVGDPESQIVATLGKSQGSFPVRGATYYMYDFGNIIVRDGKVESLPDGMMANLKRKEFDAAQKSKGLVLYKDQWVTPEQKEDLEKEATDAAAKNKPAKEEAFVQGGLRINDIFLSPRDYVEKKITIRGRFSYIYPERLTFEMKQGDRELSVIYTVAKESMAEILNQKELSYVPVEVSGTLYHLDKFFILADRVWFPKF